MGDLVTTDPGAPGLGSFLKSLAEEGRAVVGVGFLADDSAADLSALTQLDELARAELGLEAPTFSSAAALWAARLVYHFCQLTVCRDLGEERINQVVARRGPDPHTAEAVWSVDLTMRHLPRIFQFAHQLSNADPLVEKLREIAVAWPLSSVGIPKLAGFRLEPFIEHAAVRRLYADRVLAAGDESRLGDPRVDDMLRADLGIHHELSPALARKLFPNPPDPHDTH